MSVYGHDFTCCISVVAGVVAPKEILLAGPGDTTVRQESWVPTGGCRLILAVCYFQLHAFVYTAEICKYLTIFTPQYCGKV